MFSRCNHHFRPQVETLEDRRTPSTLFQATNLVSDQPGLAPVTDRSLVNGWGIALGPSASAFWVSSNNGNSTTLFDGGVGKGPLTTDRLVVSLPGGAPTGQVFNPTSDFVLHTKGGDSPAQFLTASESGHITGWSPGVSPITKAQDVAVVPGAVYKGLALVHNSGGNFLLAANFHDNRIDVFDKNFKMTHLPGSFSDPRIPAGFAPFNVEELQGKVIVTYAQQNAKKHDDVKGAGHGFVDVFDTSGHLLRRLASRGALNSPWGLAVAPSSFGSLKGDLLVGNFGNGQINAFSSSGKFLGTLDSAAGQPLVIDGLWGLTPGNGTSAGDKSALYFAAGPAGESHGLFGKITPQ